MPVSDDGIEAWIEVEGMRLEEFQVYVDVSGGEPQIVCWVPCEQGKVSAIHDVPWPFTNSLDIERLGVHHWLLSTARKSERSEPYCEGIPGWESHRIIQELF